MNEPDTGSAELQGYIHAEEHLLLVAEVLRPRFEFTPGPRGALPHGENDAKPNGAANVEVTYTLTDVESNESAEPEDIRHANIPVFEQVETLWRTHDYEILTRETDSPQRVLRARHYRDGYRVTLTEEAGGELWLSATSAPANTEGPYRS